MTQELRVRVAVTIMDMTIDNKTPGQIADAAIALVLEEAARVADAAAMVHGSGYSIDDIRDVAAAIRALKDKP